MNKNDMSLLAAASSVNIFGDLLGVGGKSKDNTVKHNKARKKAKAAKKSRRKNRKG